MCIKLTLEFFQALTPIEYLTAANAIIILYIAYQQYKISKQQVKLNLYEKRWLIYTKIYEILSIFLNIKEKEELNIYKLKSSVSYADWLFEEDIIKYINEILVKGDKYHFSLNNTSNMTDAKIDKEKELYDWFSKQFRSECKEKFKKYLNMDMIK